MKPRKNKRVFVLNIYALRHMLKFITANNSTRDSRAFINALLACDDHSTLAVSDFRSTIYPICRIDLGYRFGFNKTKLSYDYVGAYNKEIPILKDAIESEIISLSNNMMDYIKLRKHVYIQNIKDFTNDQEQNNNIDQFLQYYNTYKQNRKKNINATLKYNDVISDQIIVDMPEKNFYLDNLPEVSPSQPFVQNLFVSILKIQMNQFNEIQKSTNATVADYVQPTPVYDSYKSFIDDYKMARDENFVNATSTHTHKIVNYFTDLTWKLVVGKYYLYADNLANDPNSRWMVDLLNNNDLLKVERCIMQKLLLKYTNQKQKIRTSINSQFYDDIRDVDSKLFDIFQQLFILVNYGNDINGLFENI